ncbi:hypothetical protein SMAC4_13012 [Sordaria macrospora]|uniref:uncharacterized protein n=1 Tax=Sordaria macrospora TaxID=5147 RepID=UPI002B2E5DCF|nr:hypothetical protein SMAC4_13012 [Sordaria macrospora]
MADSCHKHRPCKQPPTILAPHKITTAYVIHCEDLTTTQNFSCRKFRLVNFSSNQPARQPTSTTTNVRSATTSSLDRKFRLVANAASRGASLSFCDGISWGSVAIDADMKVIVSRSSLSSPGSASSQQQRQAQSLARPSERIHKAMIVASGW